MVKLFRIATMLAFIGSCLAGCDRPQTQTEQVSSRCFTVSEERRFGGNVIRVTENRIPITNWDRCRELFQKFVTIHPKEQRYFFFVIRHNMTDTFIESIQQDCDIKVDITEDLRKIHTSLMNECGQEKFKKFLIENYPDLEIDIFIPSHYDEKDVSLQLKSNDIPFDSYLNGGIVLIKSGEILPICVFEDDIFFFSEVDGNKTLDLQTDFLEGCLFQYVDS
jgi:hypothetical protein